MDYPTFEYWSGLMPYLLADQMQEVGSQYILGKGKDYDMLYRVESLTGAAEFMLRKGWECEAEDYQSNKFLSFRAGNMNALLTECPVFFQDFCRAAEVCKYLAASETIRPYIEDKTIRVALHEIIRDGAAWDEV